MGRPSADIDLTSSSATPIEAEPAPRKRNLCRASGSPVIRSAPRRPASATAAVRGVQRELADRDAHPVRAEVAEAKDSFAARDYDAANIAFRPVAEDLAHPALALDGEIEAARPPDDVPELLTRLADRRRVDDRKEARWVGHEHAVEERLVGVLELRQIDVPLEIGRLAVELSERATQLRVEVVDPFG